MKRRLLSFFVLLLLNCLIGLQANNYQYLTFTNTQGNILSMNVEGLKLEVFSNMLEISNNEGTIRLQLIDLSDMYFSGEMTDVKNVLNADKPIDVYSILGVSLGTYDTLMDAAEQLPSGTYVITNGIESQRIILK